MKSHHSRILAILLLVSVGTVMLFPPVRSRAGSSTSFDPHRAAVPNVDVNATSAGLRKATILLQLLDFALEFRFVLKAIVAGPAAHDFAALPILKDTVHVFASYSSHGGAGDSSGGRSARSATLQESRSRPMARA